MRKICWYFLVFIFSNQFFNLDWKNEPLNYPSTYLVNGQILDVTFPLSFVSIDNALKNILKNTEEASYRNAPPMDDPNMHNLMLENIANILQQYNYFRSQYQAKQDDSNRQVNLANLLYLSIEHVVKYRTFLLTNSTIFDDKNEGGIADVNNELRDPIHLQDSKDIFSEYVDILRACLALYHRAASEVNHYGARYSLGLIKKLYPHVYNEYTSNITEKSTVEYNFKNNLTRVDIDSGYKEMCLSYQAYVQRLEFMHQHQSKNIINLYQHGKLTREEYFFQTALLCDAIIAHDDWHTLMHKNREKLEEATVKNKSNEMKGKKNYKIKTQTYDIKDSIISLIDHLSSNTLTNIAKEHFNSSFVKFLQEPIFYYITSIGRELGENITNTCDKHINSPDAPNNIYDEDTKTHDANGLNSMEDPISSSLTSTVRYFSIISVEGRDGVISDVNNFKSNVSDTTLENLFLQNHAHQVNENTTTIFSYHPLNLYETPDSRNSIIDLKSRNIHWYKQCNIYPQGAGCYVPLYREIPSSPKRIYSYSYRKNSTPVLDDLSSLKKSSVVEKPIYYLVVNNLIVNLVSFSSIGFYHWMTEGLSRFILSLFFLEEKVNIMDLDEQIHFIVPAIIEDDQIIASNGRPRDENGGIIDDKDSLESICVNASDRRTVPHYIETSIKAVKYFWTNVLNRPFPYKFICKADIDRVDLIVPMKGNENSNCDEKRIPTNTIIGQPEARHGTQRNPYSSTLLFADWKLNADSDIEDIKKTDDNFNFEGFFKKQITKGSVQLHPPRTLLSTINTILFFYHFLSNTSVNESCNDSVFHLLENEQKNAENNNGISSSHSVVYIARSSKNSRSIRLEDEKNLLNAVQNICSKYNHSLWVYDNINERKAYFYEKNYVTNNNIRFTNDTRVFQNASILMGVHGGGLTNLLFTSPFGLDFGDVSDSNVKTESKKILLEIALYEEEFNEFEHLAHSLPFTTYSKIENVIEPGMFDSRSLPVSMQQIQNICLKLEEHLKSFYV